MCFLMVLKDIWSLNLDRILWYIIDVSEVMVVLIQQVINKNKIYSLYIKWKLVLYFNKLFMFIKMKFKKQFKNYEIFLL